MQQQLRTGPTPTQTAGSTRLSPCKPLEAHQTLQWRPQAGASHSSASSACGSSTCGLQYNYACSTTLCTTRIPLVAPSPQGSYQAAPPPPSLIKEPGSRGVQQCAGLGRPRCDQPLQPPSSICSKGIGWQLCCTPTKALVQLVKVSNPHGLVGSITPQQPLGKWKSTVQPSTCVRVPCAAPNSSKVQQPQRIGSPYDLQLEHQPQCPHNACVWCHPKRQPCQQE